MKGVYRTRVGYTGGTQPFPTYRNMGDHTEAFQVDFDPQQIAYEELLKLFWSEHNPTRKGWSRQYMAAVWYDGPQQTELVRSTKSVLSGRLGSKIKTVTAPLDEFYLAEDYHQKYSLQHYDWLMARFKAFYPTFSDFVNSTAAARLNGFLSGYGDRKLLLAEIDSYGIDRNKLVELLGRSLGIEGQCGSGKS